MALALLLLALSCTRTLLPGDSKYLRMVGDIAFDPKEDDPDFELCNEAKAKQYHNFNQGFQYQGEKQALKKVFAEAYRSKKMPGETGLIRIRFLVNCQGKTGRFRMMGMNENYEPKTFHTSISKQLLQITRNLSGWKLLPNEQSPEDYYQYLIFKLKDGQLIEIMP
ncbi:MAG: hypothetical protein HUU01_09235 [Saprospiraceae bacterium]|nr:hypothetical protein [Saprospiraceae bacterium]